MYSRESRETGIPAHPCKDDTSVMNFGKNLQHNFPKMSGGGVKGRLELFRKFIRFGRGMRPLNLRIESARQKVDQHRLFKL